MYLFVLNIVTTKSYARTFLCLYVEQNTYLKAPKVNVKGNPQGRIAYDQVTQTIMVHEQ